MNIRVGDIELYTLPYDKIQLIRKWRNAPVANRYLFSRKVISTAEQETWFRNTQLTEDIYLMIRYGEADVGLIYTSHYDPVNRSAETNIIIGPEKYHNSGIALKACLVFTEYLFGQLFYKKLYSVVHKENTNALQIDAFLGFETCRADEKFQYLELDPIRFRSSKGFSLLRKLRTQV